MTKEIDNKIKELMKENKNLFIEITYNEKLIEINNRIIKSFKALK